MGLDDLVPSFGDRAEVAEKAEAVAEPKKKVASGSAREKAVQIGKQLGEAEAVLRREHGEEREIRIRRAMAYAAWEFDGRPAQRSEYYKEFGVEDRKVTGSLDREASKRLVGKEKKK